MATTVLLPASFVAFGTERFLFAVADHVHAAGIDGCHRQCILHGRCALFAQGNVVFDGSPLVAVPLNREVDIGVLIEEEHIGLQSRVLIGAKVGLVVIEIDVLDILREQFFIGWSCRRLWRRRGRRSDRKASSGVLRPACSLCGQVVVCGI